MKNFARRAGSLVLVLAVLLAMMQSVVAQGIVTVKLDNVDIGQFPKVVAHATVIDENGLPITGLTVDRFELIEDGRASFPPDDVQSITNDKAAVSVLILIDLSGTMSGKPLQAAKDATASFLGKLLNEGNDPDQAAFIGFGQDVDISAVTITEGAREVPFTNDTGRLLNVVNFIDVDKRTGTPLYDAVYRAIKITAQQSGRRAIIVMTDGSDVGSTLKDGDPIAEAQRQHIPVFPIGLSNSRLDTTYLKRLAQLTGGQFQEAPTPDEIGQKFEEVLSQLKVQYQLTYQSRLPEMDGQYHSLLLRVNTSRGQGFDESKFQLGQPQPTAEAATPEPVATTAPAPQPTAIPPTEKGEEGMIDGIVNWISQNMILAVGIVGAALLLLLLLMILVIVLIRRRSSGEPEPAWEGQGYAQDSYASGAAAPGWPSGPTTAGESAGYGGGMDYGAASADAFPAYDSAPPTSAGTQLASDVPPSSPFGAPSPPPFGVPPSPPFGQPAEQPKAEPPKAEPPKKKPEPEVPSAGGTVVIQRGPKLKVLGMLVDRKDTKRRFDVDKPSVTVGRAPGNTIVIDHPTVSRQHATIKLEGTDFRLYDLGSANGTFVSDPAGGVAGKRLREPVTLQDGMVVRFGEREFTFKLMSLE